MVRPPFLPVTRARVLLLGLYGLAGLMFSAWLARLPAVRDLLDLSTAALGTLLIVGSVGALITVAVSGLIVQRLGNARVLLVGSLAMGVGYALMGIGPGLGSRPLFAVGIFLNGVAGALSNIVLNVESARIERGLGRSVIPQFHATFSLGAVAGSGLGALTASAGVPVSVQFSVVAAVAVCWRLASLRGVVLAPSPDEVSPPATLRAGPGAGSRRGGALSAWREPRTLLIGVVVLAAALSEGSANTWLSLAVVDGFSEPESVGGVMLGLFVAAMTAVRLAGTRLIDRVGRVATLRISGLVSAVGLMVFGFAPNLPVAGVGVVAWGFGAALAIPIGIAAASDNPRRAAVRVAVVSTFATFASLVAPPLLGLAAQMMGTRYALVLLVVPMLAGLMAAGHVARPDDAVPDDAVPDDAVHDDAVPDDAVPDDAVPDDAVHDRVDHDESEPDEVIVGAPGSTGHLVARHHPRMTPRVAAPTDGARERR